MNDFPEFMKNPKNRIDASSQHTDDIEGYVFDGADGSQMAFWTCRADRVSAAHAHDYDEYMIVVQGRYTLKAGGKAISLVAGQEILIPKTLPHSGEAVAGTRTIHAFGGRRAERVGERP
jgi:quercetin dioxygenase-like cupin family protein